MYKDNTQPFANKSNVRPCIFKSYPCNFTYKTRMHSSSMRADRGSGHLMGVCLPSGGPGQTPPGRHHRADFPPGQTPHGQTPHLGRHPLGRHPLYTTHRLYTTPLYTKPPLYHITHSMNKMTDTCENITFPHTLYTVGNKISGFPSDSYPFYAFPEPFSYNRFSN